jgi:hypothetical protein
MGHRKVKVYAEANSMDLFQAVLLCGLQTISNKVWSLEAFKNSSICYVHPPADKSTKMNQLCFKSVSLIHNSIFCWTSLSYLLLLIL